VTAAAPVDHLIAVVTHIEPVPGVQLAQQPSERIATGSGAPAPKQQQVT